MAAPTVLRTVRMPYEHVDAGRARDSEAGSRIHDTLATQIGPTLRLLAPVGADVAQPSIGIHIGKSTPATNLR
ncbi:hypothetical protein [Nocardia sp. NPDC050710]|uniref:hypothetical protein n=1 Tax=Nocardia sp. NPDC050710 TaxID=3157220 RepID=UPI0033FB40DB